MMINTTHAAGRDYQIQLLIDRARKDLVAAEANLSVDETAAYAFAYLAMLRTARAYLLFSGHDSKDLLMHDRIIKTTASCLEPRFSRYVKYLEHMSTKKSMLDSKILNSILREEAVTAVDVSNKFVKELTGLMDRITSGQQEFEF